MIHGHESRIIVPTFRPDRENVDNIRWMSRCAPVVVVDDGSPIEFAPMLEELASAPNVSVVRQGMNRGIAAALNAGCELAVESGAEYLVTFDQDSRPSPDHLEKLCAVLFDGSVGLAGPGVVEGSIQRAFRHPGPEVRHVTALIQSGMGFTRSVFETLGPFDENLVIDGVDTEYCLRARRFGLSVVAHGGLSLSHSIGAGTDSRTLSFLGRSITATLHPPFRRYYVNRNLILLLGRYGLREPRWAFGTIVRTMKFNLAVLLMEPDKGIKTKAALTGIMAGLAGETGQGRGASFRA